MSKRGPGLFITLEGIEGSGKSTQAALLKSALEAEGRTVVLTREPGDTRIGRRIRELLLDPEAHLIPLAELFLYQADRAQHVEEVIRPALEAGKIVVCDRYADSSTAYQGGGRGVPSVGRLNRIATDGLTPGLTLLLDLPVEKALKRARSRAATPAFLDRIEREALEFHQRVRDSFRRMARREKKRFRVIDADRPEETVAAEVLQVTRARLR